MWTATVSEAASTPPSASSAAVATRLPSGPARTSPVVALIHSPAESSDSRRSARWEPDSNPHNTWPSCASGGTGKQWGKDHWSKLRSASETRPQLQDLLTLKLIHSRAASLTEHPGAWQARRCCAWACCESSKQTAQGSGRGGLGAASSTSHIALLHARTTPDLQTSARPWRSGRLMHGPSRAIALPPASSTTCRVPDPRSTSENGLGPPSAMPRLAVGRIVHCDRVLGPGRGLWPR